MADDALALSPLNARASLPSEADYDAICDAFMETARGRWFLGEYAKRNRNADTRMVLDVVERIEATVATQKQAARQPIDALPAMIDAVAEARLAIAAVLASGSGDTSLEPVLRSARAIREVSWTLRECGADTRICDLLDAQVKTIDAGCERVKAAGVNSEAIHESALAIVDDLALRIRVLGKGEAGETSPPSVAPIARAEMLGEPDDELSVVELDDESYDAVVEATSAAILDDPQDAARYGFAAPSSVQIIETRKPRQLDRTEPIAPRPPILPVDLLDDIEIVEIGDSLVAAPQSAPAASAASSLGHALISNGVIPHPNELRSDPLAPFRRMSQVDKIAFFT